jgi:hypothetical protein
MPTPTYTPLATVTLASATGSVTFSSIPATYRDLIVVLSGTRTGNNNIHFRFNDDSGSNYLNVAAAGSGSGTTSLSETTTYNFVTVYALETNTQLNTIFQVMDYSATDKHKTSLTRFSQAGSGVTMFAGRWANTAAINSIRVFTGNNDFGTGTVMSLYGVIA